MATTLHDVPIPRERLGAPRDPKSEAAELRRLRDGFALTQVQMAQLLDVGPATYQRYERGANLCPLAVLELMRCWSREEGAGKRRK